MEVGDSPPSPTVYWVPKLKLGDTDRKQLVDGARLTDKHMDGSAQLLVPRHARTTVYSMRTATWATSAG